MYGAQRTFEGNYIRKPRTVIAFIVILFFGMVTSIYAAQNDPPLIFVEIKGIKGDSSEFGYKDCVVAKGFGMGFEVKTEWPSSSSGIDLQPPSFNGLTILKNYDIATPLLALAGLKGTHIDEVVVSVVENMGNGDRRLLLEMTMEYVIISELRINERTDANAGEEVTFKFGKITWEAPSYDSRTGQSTGSVTSCFDLERNSGC